MEAVVLKATLAKNAQQEKKRAQDERNAWKGKVGVKAVTATPPTGGW